MLTILAQGSKVARYEAVERMLDHFNGGSLFDVSTLVYPALALGAVFLLLGGWRSYQTRKLRSAPLYTFHQLATGLGVRLGEQWLLARIARREHLPTPLTLLVSSGTLRHHAGRYVERVSSRRRVRVMAEVGHIERMVFGGRDGDDGR